MYKQDYNTQITLIRASLKAVISIRVNYWLLEMTRNIL